MKITCLDCGKKFEGTSRKKYCDSCVALRRKKNNLEYARKHNVYNEEVKRKRREALRKKVSENKARGIKNSAKSFSLEEFIRQPDPFQIIQFSMPFTYAMSKNHIWSLGNGRNTVYKRAETKALEDEIIYRVRSFKDVKFHQNKIWLDIFVEKPDNKGDAINFLDLIADSVKKAIEIDDRWFSVGRIDWKIVKENPQVTIRIYQEEDWDAYICSYCGRLLPCTCYRNGKSKSAKRECKECLGKDYHFTQDELHNIDKTKD